MDVGSGRLRGSEERLLVFSKQRPQLTVSAIRMLRRRPPGHGRTVLLHIIIGGRRRAAALSAGGFGMKADPLNSQEILLLVLLRTSQALDEPARVAGTYLRRGLLSKIQPRTTAASFRAEHRAPKATGRLPVGLRTFKNFDVSCRLRFEGLAGWPRCAQACSGGCKRCCATRQNL